MPFGANRFRLVIQAETIHSGNTNSRKALPNVNLGPPKRIRTKDQTLIIDPTQLSTQLNSVRFTPAVVGEIPIRANGLGSSSG